jgi:glycosyltransferase involved in cell wall biosynthesis
VSDPDFRSLRRGRLMKEGKLCERVPAMVDVIVSDRNGNSGFDPLRLVCVGRIEPIKGIELLVRTVRRLHERGTTCQLQVIGDGSQRSQLEALVAKLRLGEAVTFLGSLGQRDVQRVLAYSDVFVSGSYQEGFSLALLEGLASGLPAVVTDVGSARDVVQDGITGFVVNRRDPDLFAGCVAAAASARWQMRPHCRRAAEEYGSSKVSIRIMETLRHVADRRSWDGSICAA